MNPPSPTTLHHYFTSLGAKGGTKGSPAQQSARAQVFRKRWPTSSLLTAAERAVLELRAAGQPFAAIAQARHTSLGTVLNQSCSACRKLGIKSTTHAPTVREALRQLDMSDPAFS